MSVERSGPSPVGSAAPRRSRRAALGGLLVLTVLAGAAAGAWLADARGSGGPAPATVAPPALGVFRETDAREVAGFEEWLGRPVDVVVDFSSRDTWEDIARPTYMLEEWARTSLRPVYGIAMLPDDPGPTIAQGADGAYDVYFRTLAEELVDHGQEDAVLRVGWEFNLEASRWSTPDSDAFTRYWRRIVHTMRSVPGQAFAFDWNVNNSTNRYDAVRYYPGDDVVDIVGVDVYDVSGREDTYPYPEPCDPACRQARQQRAWDAQIYGGERGLRFWASFARERGKPLSLPEWGLWDRPDGTGGGDNPFFVERMQEVIADPANRVAYHAYFEFDGPNGQHSLRRAFPVSGQVFRHHWGR